MNRAQIAAIPAMTVISFVSMMSAIPHASAAQSTDNVIVDSGILSSISSRLMDTTISKAASKAASGVEKQEQNTDNEISDLVKKTAKLGSRTIKADWGDDAEYISGLAKKVADAGSISDWAIVTDTANSRTCVFRSFKGAWVCVQRFDCAVGSIQSDGHSSTQAGNHVIDHKSSSTAEGNCWWSCVVPWWGDNGEDDGQGFHDGFDGTTGMITHGCTRLYQENAKYIYDNVTVGSRVIVI